MADKNAGKGGGARKYKRNTHKCAAYKLRESHGNTAKTRRIARALRAKKIQPGWFLSESGRPMRG